MLTGLLLDHKNKQSSGQGDPVKKQTSRVWIRLAELTLSPQKNIPYITLLFLLREKSIYIILAKLIN